MEMGRVAGAAAAGDWVEFKMPTLSTLLQLLSGRFLNWAGHLPDGQVRTVVVSDPAAGYFKKSYLQDGVLGEIIIAPQVDSSESMEKLAVMPGREGHNKWKCKVCGYIHEGPNTRGMSGMGLDGKNLNG